jgi:hypothetical protein
MTPGRRSTDEQIKAMNQRESHFGRENILPFLQSGKSLCRSQKAALKAELEKKVVFQLLF